MELRFLGPWFGGGVGGVGLMVRLDLRGLFQPKWFCDSMLLT